MKRTDGPVAADPATVGQKDRQATVTNYMNTFVTAALSLEPEISLLAQTVLEPVDHVITDGRESIDRLCQAYDSAPGDFAEQNPDIRLNKGIPIRIEQGVYLAQNQKAPGRDLKKIQAFFGVTLDQLKAANPRRIHWPDLLDEGEALALPPMTIVTDEKELSSLTSISEKYGCDTKLLAALNRDTPGLLSAGQSVHLMGGLKICAGLNPRHSRRRVYRHASRPRHGPPDRGSGADHGPVHPSRLPRHGK